jgi:adenylate cyclase
MERKFAAILNAEVQGYSRLRGDNEETPVRTFTQYRQLMTSLNPQYRGRVVDSPGDNLLADYNCVVDAMQYGVAIWQELETRNQALVEHGRMR